MSNYKVKLKDSEKYVAALNGGYIAGEGNKDYVWNSKDEAKQAIKVCEKHWGKMELIAA